MKVLKIKYYKRPTIKTGVVSANTGEFTIDELEDAKRLIEMGIEAEERRIERIANLKNDFKKLESTLEG